MLTKTLQVLDTQLNPVEYTKFEETVYASRIIVTKQKDKYRSWSFYVTSETPVTMENVKLEGKCFIYYVQGIVGGKGYPRVSAGTALLPAYVGKKNELNQFLRGIEIGNTKLKNKIKAGYTEIETADKVTTFEDINEDINCAPVPEQFKPKNDHITFPLWVSIKYDGASLICCYHPSFKNHKDKILLYTRNRKIALGFDDLRETLKPVLKNYPGLFLVGEVYEHGLTRNAINSIHSRNVNGSLNRMMSCSYYIFDCFYAFENTAKLNFDHTSSEIIDLYNQVVETQNKHIMGVKIDFEKYITSLDSLLEMNVTGLKSILEYQQNYSPTNLIYTQRQKIIDSVVKECDFHNVRMAKKYYVETKEELDEIFKDVVDEGYEGLVARKDVTYAFSLKKKKINPNNFKVKTYEEEEFEIIDYNLGEGEAAHNVIFVVKDKKTGKTFSPTMSITEPEMKELYKEVIADFSKFKGKLLTVKFEKRSEFGIPLFPKGLTIREDI